MYGYTNSIDRAIRAIEKAKPAHLIYDFSLADAEKTDLTIAASALVITHEKITIKVS